MNSGTPSMRPVSPDGPAGRGSFRRMGLPAPPCGTIWSAIGPHVSSARCTSKRRRRRTIWAAVGRRGAFASMEVDLRNGGDPGGAAAPPSSRRRHGPRSPTTTRRPPAGTARCDPAVREDRDERTRTGRARARSTAADSASPRRLHAAVHRRDLRRPQKCSVPGNPRPEAVSEPSIERHVTVDRTGRDGRGARARVRTGGPRRRRAAQPCADEEGLPCPAPSSPCRFACSRTAS